MISKSSASILLLALLIAAAPAAADQAVRVTPGDDSNHPAVAYDSARDRYLTVWVSSFGNLEGEIRSADGEAILTPTRPLLHSEDSPDGFKWFHSPRVTYQAVRDLWVVTMIWEPPGALFRRLEVAAFDSLLNLQWFKTARIDPTIRHPDIVADTHGTTCCILLVWEEASGERLLGMQLTADGGVEVPMFEVHRSTSQRALRPRIAYQGDPNDEFLVVYFVRSRAGAWLEARSVTPLSATLGDRRVIDELSEHPILDEEELLAGTDEFAGGPDVAYDENARRYLVSWLDDGDLYAQYLDHDALHLGGRILLAGTLGSIDVLGSGVPEVVAVEDYGLMLVAHPRANPRFTIHTTPTLHWRIEGWWIDHGGGVSSSAISDAWPDRKARSPVAAWSPAMGKGYAAWERDEVSPLSPPPRDIFWQKFAP